jgi:hypothetical protein
MAAQPASNAERLVLRTLFWVAEGFWAVMSNSTGLQAPRSDREGGA